MDLTYKEYLFRENKIRQALQEKLYHYYVGDQHQIEKHLHKAMYKTWHEDDIEEYQLNWINITKKIVDMLSMVYHQPAERRIVINGEDSEDLTAYYLEKVTQSNAKDKLAHRLGKLQGTSLTQIYFDSKIINYRVQSSDYYTVKVNEENKITMLTYDKLYEVNGRDEVFTVVWTPEEHYKVDMNGNKSSIGSNEERLNYFKVMPFAKLTPSEGEDFWGNPLSDIANVNEQINVLLTLLVNDSIIMGTAGTTLAVNCKFRKKNTDGSYSLARVKTGKRHPITVEDVRTDEKDPSLQHVTTEPYIKEIQESIDWYIKLIALSKGLNPNSFLQGVKAVSGYSKIVDAIEQLEVRRDDIETCRNYENERFEVVKRVNNYYAKTQDGRNAGLKQIPDNAELVVDFAEIEIPKTQDEIWLQREKELANNMSTPKDWLIEKNPDLTEEMAIEVIQNNKDFRKQFINGSERPPGVADALINRLNNNQETPDE